MERGPGFSTCVTNNARYSLTTVEEYVQPEGDILSEDTIDALVRKASGGDAGAFGTLYDHYLDLIYRHIYYRVGDVHDAEDLTQQVFMKAWKALGKYKKKSAFGAWLMTISRNLIIDHYRARKEKDSIDEKFDLESRDPGPEEIAEASFEQERIKKVINRLPEEQQQVIIMKFIDCYEYKEIADMLGKKEGAVRIIQHRALRKLHQLLDEGTEQP